MAAAALTVEAAVIARAQPQALQLYVPAADNKPRFHSSLVAIVRYSAAIASRHKKAAPVVAVDADVAMTAAVAADAVAVTN
jgi:hypothetical protein